MVPWSSSWDFRPNLFPLSIVALGLGCKGLTISWRDMRSVQLGFTQYSSLTIALLRQKAHRRIEKLDRLWFHALSINLYSAQQLCPLLSRCCPNTVEIKIRDL